ncbi:hypothetical protein EGW08_021076 [Elysia chlorotica]|uniref:RWD domain-containing protein n=1 Tax=Elysia chlorotica TaxID=188477 RepID=A0A3S0ZBJ2_ELYCH|nr:hypothetical protein EGW08_021076 [Elysia chlorotica]
MASSQVSDSSTPEAEVTSIKASYPGQCRVVKDVGQFSHVITVQPAEMDATIKFQIPADYPKAKPVVTVRSESLVPETLQDLTEAIQARARAQPDGAMLQALIDFTTEHLAAVGLRPNKARKLKGDTDLCDTNSKKKNKRRKQKSGDTKDEGEGGDEKLPPMKTASDVVNRIIWDDALEKDDFIVGYFDRFRGLMERSFSAFSWEDLAAVDYDVLAVPKHRIQYFKFKDVKVWDKPRRLDNVFGSAKGTKTIDVVIREVEEEEERAKHAQKDGSGGATSKQGVNDERSDASHSDGDDDSDDSDDGITVTIGSKAGIGTTPTAQSKPTEASKGASLKVEEEQNGEGQGEAAGGAYNKYWRDKLRPNHFICVRLTDPALVERICSVHDHLIEQDPSLAECCIPGASLHVTLCMLGLDTAEQLRMCMDALSKAKADLKAAVPPSPLHLHGSSQFYNRVVYAKVHHKQDFLAFCDLLKTLLREAGVQIRDGYEFVPHATIMKVTRPVARERRSTNIDPAIYAPFVDTEFGYQKIDAIYLCSIGSDRRSDGFYLTPLELDFTN